MNHIDLDLFDMTLDIAKYTISRITQKDVKLRKVLSEEELYQLVGETVTQNGIGGENALKLWKDVLSKSTIPIDHPRHLAFVPAAPSRAAVVFDLVTSACSIHGAYWLEGAGGIYAENQAMKWIVELTGMPLGAFGVFTSGGTAANLSAIIVARDYWRSLDKNREKKRGLIITSFGAHSSIMSMAKIVDVDIVCIDEEDIMTGEHIQNAINLLNEEQRSSLFCIVATGGTTNAGIIDDLSTIAKLCKKYSLWMHVDAAYGGGALAADSVRHLFGGIEEADSITIDPHKWLFSPYDCGAIIYRNPEIAKKSHKQEGSYLDIFNDLGAAGFNPSDYQIQLTRRVRGLALWFSLAMHGTDKYKEAIEYGIQLANETGNLIEKLDYLNLVRPPSLSCVLFRRIGWRAEDYKKWTFDSLNSGLAFVAPTRWGRGEFSESVFRLCFINPATTMNDVEMILKSMS